ncbi:MAG TPA: hypothetical protein VMX54_21410 [Vicinamibacteria bacterium]|nr:hypothetical protein [Vicinamibacteria bacterium]
MSDDTEKKIQQHKSMAAAHEQHARELLQFRDARAALRAQPPTEEQQAMLVRWGYWRPGMTAGEAADVIRSVGTVSERGGGA